MTRMRTPNGASWYRITNSVDGPSQILI